MRFSLLGTHPDGVAMARALVGTGRHELVAFVGRSRAAEALRNQGLRPKVVGDLEEVLADPAVEAVIVADEFGDRGALLRRALQSERDVLCVHPAAPSPEVAYEAALIQGDTRHVLLPLLTEFLHPGVHRVADLIGAGQVGSLQLLEVERGGGQAVAAAGPAAEHKPSFRGWDVLRAVGGEVVEVSGFAAEEAVSASDAVLLAGRCEGGGLFQVTLLPGLAEPRWRLTAVGTSGQVELVLPHGWPGPAQLRWRDGTGEAREEGWGPWDPWPALVAIFETARATDKAGGETGSPNADGRWSLRWQDEVRCLELDDAARRSIQRRRTSTLEYQEVSEEVGFKGTMTLVGCGLLWGMLLLVILSRWFPPLGWVIIPLLVIFLVLQLLRWIIPRTRPEPGQAGPRR